MKKPSLPDIPESERTPEINMLLKVIEYQAEMIDNLSSEVDNLKSEVKRLKNHPKRPKIKPSKMDKKDPSKNSDLNNKKRAGSSKRKKTEKLKIDKEETIEAEDVPANAVFKGYDQYVVQELEIKCVNTKYKLARWKLDDGRYLVAQLPENIRNFHFGPFLRCFAVYQYHHLCVTQPLLLAQLRELGIDISSGQLNRLLVENKDEFHQEKDAILQTGLSVSNYINVDDTGARHQARNGYCSHIGNEFFAWFKSTASKSRINFLELLRAGYNDYCVNADALDYMKKQRLPAASYNALSNHQGTFQDSLSWITHLEKSNITTARHIKIATEGALIGSVLSHGFNVDLAIVSDDAGQFNIFKHTLCWIHAERKINEINPVSNENALEIDDVRQRFWTLYDNLKLYKENPKSELKIKLSNEFDSLFNTKTKFYNLKQVLNRLSKNKSELLLVLDRPELPLHNNLSERDIREYVKRRKVSGGTRSDEGQLCRDTFASLKKTCLKLKIAFWDYLLDRVNGQNKIPPISDLILLAAAK